MIFTLSMVISSITAKCTGGVVETCSGCYMNCGMKSSSSWRWRENLSVISMTPSWLCDFAFMVDITKYLSELNIMYQDPNQLLISLLSNVKSFEAKWMLWKMLCMSPLWKGKNLLKQLFRWAHTLTRSGGRVWLSTLKGWELLVPDTISCGVRKWVEPILELMTIRVTEARLVRMLIVCWIDMYSFGHLSGVNFVKEFGWYCLQCCSKSRELVSVDMYCLGINCWVYVVLLRWCVLFCLYLWWIELLCFALFVFWCF